MNDDAAAPAQEETVTSVDPIAIWPHKTQRPGFALLAERIEQKQGQ